MKSQFKYFFVSFFLISVLSAGLSAAEKGKSQVVNIKTSAICGSCKARIERAVKAVDGVEEALLNLHNKKLKVKFDPLKTDAGKIRTTVSNTGYDADEIKKNEEAFNKLPECCQRPMEGDMHH